MGSQWQKTSNSSSFSANREGIVRLASRQKNLIKLEQLEALGLSKSSVRSRVQARRLFRLHASVYATHPPPYSRHQHYLAAIYACAEGSSLIGVPSAWLYGLVETAPLIADVNNPSGRGRSRPGINVHRRSID